jgi:hypothetical protein
MCRTTRVPARPWRETLGSWTTTSPEPGLREGNPMAQFAQTRRQTDSDSFYPAVSRHRRAGTAGYGVAALQVARQQHRPFTLTHKCQYTAGRARSPGERSESGEHTMILLSMILALQESAFCVCVPRTVLAVSTCDLPHGCWRVQRVYPCLPGKRFLVSEVVSRNS